MPVLFKLKFGEEARRLTFAELPSWGSLSSRLATLYGISPDKDTLGVSYTDLDGDEITLNTDEELLDFYKTSSDTQPAQPFRLKVVDLASLRGGTNVSPHVGLDQVGPFTFDIDDDWQRLPSFLGSSDMHICRKDTGQASPHAFVQVVESDAESTQGPKGEDKGSSTTPTAYPGPDKGKGREDLNFPSTVSLLDDEVEEKHPIHVMDRSNQAVDEWTFDTTATLFKEDVPPSVTPELASIVKDTNAPQEEEDPPLPTIDNDPASPSLTEDISILISSLSAAIISNPELSDTFRRIMHNTTSGSYWRSHRESLSQTVNNLSRSMGTATEEFRNNTEADAARNISQTLGSLFHSLSAPFQGTVSPDDHPTTTVEAQMASPHMPGSFSHPHGLWRHGHFRPFGRSSQPRGPPPPPFPPFGENFRPHQPLGHPTPPSPPPPPPPPHTLIPQTEPTVSTANDDPKAYIPYPTVPPEGSPHFTGALRVAPSGEEPISHADRIWDPEMRPSWLPPQPPIEGLVQPPSEKPNPQELRAAVEAAKQRYKEEKERYRREREERRRHKGAMNMTPVLNSSTVPLSRETSDDSHPQQSLGRSSSYGVHYHNRGPNFPPEMDSFSRRTTVSSIKRSSEELNARALARISKKLADMGFTETSHPNLPTQIKLQLPYDKTLSKDEEDNVVTTLLEDLLAMSPKATTPKTPVASGSAIRENISDVPGGWH